MLSLSESYQNLLKKFQRQVEQSNKKDHEWNYDVKRTTTKKCNKEKRDFH